MNSPSPYSTFHRDRHLLLQFIVKEFLHIFPILKSLTHLLSQKALEGPTSLQTWRATSFLEELDPYLRDLLGGINETLRPLSWPFGEGRLAKLKGYSAWLLQEAMPNDQPLLLMDQLANKAWIWCIKSFDAVHSSRQNDEIYAPLEKMLASLKRFARTLPQGIKLFLHDENVLFFVLRHQKELDHFYEAKFTHKLLSDSFPKGIPQVKAFLLEKYRQRGFQKLLPKIKELCAQIDLFRN